MIELQVEFKNRDNIKKLLKIIERDLEDMSIPLKRSGVYMLGSIDRNFRSQGRPKPWAPLSPLTIARRRTGKGTGSMRILQDTGRLKQSITTETAMRMKDKFTLGIGTSVPYARIHQQGGKQKLFNTGKMVTIPKRPFLLFQDKDKDAINKIFDNYVSSIIKKFR
jgi:phage virion morphogenesis protein